MWYRTSQDEIPKPDVPTSEVNIPFMRSLTPEQLFGVAEGGEPQQGYREFSRTYHPDVNPDPNAQQAFLLGTDAMTQYKAGNGKLPIGSDASFPKEWETDLHPLARQYRQKLVNTDRNIGLRVIQRVIKDALDGDAEKACTVLARMQSQTPVMNETSVARAAELLRAAAHRPAHGWASGEREKTEYQLYHSIIALFEPDFRIPQRPELKAPSV